MSDLNILRKKIENLQESTHEEIFRLIQKYNIPFTENSNGIFINMVNMTDACVSELSNHVKWLEEQRDFLSKAETVKQTYRENFFQ